MWAPAAYADADMEGQGWPVQGDQGMGAHRSGGRRAGGRPGSHRAGPQRPGPGRQASPAAQRPGARRRAPQAADDGRWVARPRQAAAVRVAVFLGPVVTSFVAAWFVTGLLPPSSGFADQVAHLLVLVVVSTLVLLALDRAARRLLPLAALLDLALLFPGTAPSRLAVAREAIRRRPIEAQLSRVREAGADPGVAATEILSLVAAMSRHDKPTRGHAERVRMFTDLIAEQMRIPERDRDLLRWAAILHDIGKLRIPGSLLNKSGRPEPYEWIALRAHPAHGADIAAGLLPWLGEWGRVIPEHHERWDGGGYPRGLQGDQIHVGARIVAVADAYDVMTSVRAYRRPVSRTAAYQELVRHAGSQFDPVAVRAMVSVSAPRMRRAQGVLAGLANLPLVATHVVPASALARVVGAGVVAGTSAAGVAVPATVPAAEPQVVVRAVPAPTTEAPTARTDAKAKAKAKPKASKEKSKTKPRKKPAATTKPPKVRPSKEPTRTAKPRPATSAPADEGADPGGEPRPDKQKTTTAPVEAEPAVTETASADPFAGQDAPGGTATG